jgi:hypothetical protein
MQGVTFDLMMLYAVGELGEPAWAGILDGVGRSGQEYEVEKSYPDDEFAQLAVHVAQAMGKPLPYVLEGFGAAMVPEMIDVYGFLVDRRWSYIDFLLNMQPMLESAFKLQAPGAVAAQRIRVSRLGPEEVSIVYESNLRACAIVRGACRGAAEHYGVDVVIIDEQCLLRGDRACVISVRREHLDS